MKVCILYSDSAGLCEIIFIRLFISGMHVNFEAYDETDKRIKFFLNLFLYGIIVPIRSIYATPFILVAYHLCVGEYSVNSWITIIPVWYVPHLDCYFIRVTKHSTFILITAGCLLNWTQHLNSL